MTATTIPQLWSAALAQHAAGHLPEAESFCRQILNYESSHARAWGLLGTIAIQVGKPEIAVDLISRALGLQPDLADSHNNLANALLQLGRADEAIQTLNKAIQLRPDFAAAYNNLGNALRAFDRLDDAAAAYARAVELHPTFAQAHHNLGVARIEQRQIEEAIASHRRAVAAQPNWALAHFNLGLALLQNGNFGEGWQEHEWRLGATELGNRCQQFPEPRWTGDDLGDRTLLLHTEQGFGDAIQFVRYLPKIAARGGKIILQCQKELLPLFNELPGIVECLERDAAGPKFDVHCPLASLPLLFATTADSIPATVPYLRSPSSLKESWQNRLTEHSGKLKVGLTWAGRATPDPRRSIPPTEFVRLGVVQNASFFAIQTDQPKPSLPGMHLIDLSGELRDFAESAALIEQLDLVISVDTAVAHLAGALGKQVWLLLPYAADWRWMLDRDDSPWYPTMRLFRQSTPGDWGSPLAQVVQALRGIA